MKIDVSIGELVDKVTILSIKLKKVKDKEKLKNIGLEYKLLKESMESIGITIDSEEFLQLEEVNLNLWQVEDEIRFKEMKKEFDDEFIKLARAIYFENDKRSEIKRNINLKFGSELIEEKEYTKYGSSPF